MYQCVWTSDSPPPPLCDVEEASASPRPPPSDGDSDDGVGEELDVAMGVIEDNLENSLGDLLSGDETPSDGVHRDLFAGGSPAASENAPGDAAAPVSVGAASADAARTSLIPAVGIIESTVTLPVLNAISH